MDLPKHYLPTRTCPHVGVHPYQRLLFADYGSYENVNVTIDRDDSRELISCWPQKGHGTIKDLSELLPSLPLFDHPLQDEWNEGDCILGVKNFNDSMGQLKRFVAVLNTAKGHISKNGKKFQYVEKFKAMRMSYKKFGKLSQYFNDDGIFQKLLSDYTEISKAHNMNCLNGFNRDYYGGLLSASSSNEKDKHYLSYVGGPHMRDIYVAAVSTDPNSCLKTPHVLCKHSLDGRLLQLDTHSTSDGKFLICTRKKEDCSLFLADFVGRSLDLQGKVTLSNDSWTSTSFSQYLENEVLLSSACGDVYLWDINSHHDNIIQKTPRFHCPDRWSCSYFAGHPREIVVADNTSAEIFDHRSQFENGLELFSLSSKLTTSNERIMGASFLDFPYHAVATDFTLFIMDQRFCSTPVFQWSTEFKAAPQYLKIINNEIFPGKLIFLASQQPAEVMTFSLDLKSDVPTSSLLPWKTSAIGDFNQCQYRDYICDINTANRKFQTSLAGVAVTDMSRSGGYTVYQMDSYGDVFYQTINMHGSSSYCMVDRATVPERHAASCRIENWLRGFDRIVQSSYTNKQVLNVSKQTIDPKIVAEVQSSPLASLETTAANPKTTLHKNLKKVDSLPHGCQAKLLMALYKGDDISTLLEEREEYHEKEKKKMKEKLLQKKKVETSRKSRRTTSVHCKSSGGRSKCTAVTSAVSPYTHSSDEKSTQEPHMIETSDRQLRDISTRKKNMSLVSPDPVLTEISDTESLESSGSLFNINEFRDISSDSSGDYVCHKEKVKKRPTSRRKLEKASQKLSKTLPPDHKQLNVKVTNSPFKRKARSQSEQKQKKPNTELNSSFSEEKCKRLDLSITSSIYKEIYSSPNPFELQDEEGTHSPIIPLQYHSSNENVITKPSVITSLHQAKVTSCDITSDWSSDIPLAQGGSTSSQSILPSQVTFNASLFGPMHETLMTQNSEASIIPFDILKTRSGKEFKFDTTQICKMLFEDSQPPAFESEESQVLPVTTTQNVPVEPNLNMTQVSGATQDTLFSYNNELSGLFKHFHLSQPDGNPELTLDTSHVSDSTQEILFSDSNRSSPLKNLIFSHSTPFEIKSGQESSSCGRLGTSLTKKKLEFETQVSSARENYQQPVAAIQNTSPCVSDVYCNKGSELNSKDQFQKIFNWLQESTNESDMPNNLFEQMNTPSKPSFQSSGHDDRQTPQTGGGTQSANNKQSRSSHSDSDSDSVDSVCSSLPASITRMSLLSPGMKYLVDPNLAGFLSSPSSLRKKKLNQVKTTH